VRFSGLVMLGEEGLSLSLSLSPWVPGNVCIDSDVTSDMPVCVNKYIGQMCVHLSLARSRALSLC
jgi:hypothetical protein